MGWKFLCCVAPERSKKRTLSIETILDFSRCNLSELPMIEDNIDFITEMDFSFNKIRELDPILMRAKNLKVLNLSDNQLKHIPEQLSSAFKNLRSINISHNLMNEIPTFFNANFEHLHSLDLSNNPISKILDGTITELVCLKELRLNTCNLNFLPANIARLINLESLELRENYLETLPPSIKMLTKLQLLDIGRNNFEELPVELGYLFNIRELILDENNLVEVSVVSELINLRHLDISNNNLMAFPEDITKCSMLETLYGDGNEFETLPDSIENLKSLIRLNLNYVHLKQLTSAIGYCQSLEELNIHENFLEYLPSTIGFLRNLQILVAYENRLIQLPNELASCVSLKLLNVANNKLKRLPDNIGYLKQLKSLNVMGNYLMYLPLSLDMLQNLEGLWLSPYQEGMKKPNLTRIELSEGIVLTSYLLEQKPIYKSNDQKNLKNNCKIQFNVNNGRQSDDEERNEPTEKLRSPENHIMRIPTPTQRERKRLEKFARTINAERRDLSKSFEIKEARVASTSSSYTNIPRQRRSLDPEYIEINTANEFRPLPPPYIVACQYSKMSPSELENFQKMNRNSISNNNDYTNSTLPLLSKNNNDLVQ